MSQFGEFALKIYLLRQFKPNPQTYPLAGHILYALPYSKRNELEELLMGRIIVTGGILLYVLFYGLMWAAQWLMLSV